MRIVRRTVSSMKFLGFGLRVQVIHMSSTSERFFLRGGRLPISVSISLSRWPHLTDWNGLDLAGDGHVLGTGLDSRRCGWLIRISPSGLISALLRGIMRSGMKLLLGAVILLLAVASVVVSLVSEERERLIRGLLEFWKGM